MEHKYGGGIAAYFRLPTLLTPLWRQQGRKHTELREKLREAVVVASREGYVQINELVRFCLQTGCARVLCAPKSFVRNATLEEDRA